MKKSIILFLISVFCFGEACHAAINFEVEKTEWNDRTVYDIKNHLILGPGNNYDWSLSSDIPTIDSMPEPNITEVANGYISKIDGEYYLAGRLGTGNSVLPVLPLGTDISGLLDYISTDQTPDIFPYNCKDNIKYEIEEFNSDSDGQGGLKNKYGDIAKWVFGWDGNKTYIFADGINAVETNLTFSVLGRPVVPDPDITEIIFWEDEDTFYIRNYNILLKTPKQQLYDTLEELENTPKVKYNDTFLSFKNPPVIKNGRTLIPVRFLFEQMGANVDWNEREQTVTISKNDIVITLAVGSTNAEINGKPLTMDAPAQIINGKTMVPVRFISENLGYEVEWDDENRIITIME